MQHKRVPGRYLLTDAKRCLQEPSENPTVRIQDLLREAERHLGTLGYFQEKAKEGGNTETVDLAVSIYNLKIAILKALQKSAKALAPTLKRRSNGNIRKKSHAEVYERIPPMIEGYEKEVEGIDIEKMQQNLSTILSSEILATR